MRWRASVLLLATFLFFPVFIAVLILNALLEDMPALRTAVKRGCQALGAWVHLALRLPDLRRVVRNLALPGMAAPGASPSQS